MIGPHAIFIIVLKEKNRVLRLLLTATLIEIDLPIIYFAREKERKKKTASKTLAISQLVTSNFPCA